MKKVVTLLLLLCLCLISSTAFAEEKQKVVSKEQKEIIQNVYSFSDSHMKDLTNEQLSEYLIDIDKVEVSKKEEYFRIDYVFDKNDLKQPKDIKRTKVTKEEVELALNNSEEQTFSALSSSSCGITNGYDCIQETGFIKLETWIAKSNSSNGKVSARFEWLKSQPYYTDKDVFAIGLNSNFSPLNGTQSAVYKADYWTIRNTIATHTENYTTAVRDAGGYGFIIDLYDTGFNHRGYMEYQFKKNVTNVTLADAYSHYAHQEKIWSITPSFTIPLGGSLNLSSSTSFTILKGHAQLNPW